MSEENVIIESHNKEELEREIEKINVTQVKEENTIIDEEGRCLIKSMPDIYEENQVSSFIQKLYQRMGQINASIHAISEQSKDLNNENYAQTFMINEKMLIFRELFNEVHLMCGECQQIISHLRQSKTLHVDMESNQISEAVLHTEKILYALSELKDELQKRMSILIENAERLHVDHADKSFDKICSTENCSLKECGKSSGNTELESDAWPSSETASSECARLKFMSDYILTLSKNIEELESSVGQIDSTSCETTTQGISDKIKELKVLERHLNRNEPLVKEIEFWLCYDLSKTPFSKDDDCMRFLKQQFDSLCSKLLQARALTTEKQQLLTTQLERRIKQQSEEKKTHTAPLTQARHTENAQCNNVNNRRDSNTELKDYYEYVEHEKCTLLKEVGDAKNKMVQLNNLLDSINEMLEAHRYVPITNDASVAQLGHLYKTHQQLLDTHQDDLSWLQSFTDPIKLCQVDVPDTLIYQVMELSIRWRHTSDRIAAAQATFNKARELWVLLEYYIMRITLWTESYKISLDNPNRNAEKWEKEAQVIQKKLSRVDRIKNKLSTYIGKYSSRIIEYIWRDTKEKFGNALAEH